MKRFVFAFMAILFIFLNCLPSSFIFADSGYTNSQLADIGSLMLTNLIASGEATELDFSDYTDNEGLDFLISLGELAVTGDPTGLIDQGLTWLGGELSDVYDSLIGSIREWEYSVAPDLYNWWYQGTQYEYKLQPAYDCSRPLRDLLKSPDDLPIPQPDPDYASYIDAINGQGWTAIRSPIVPLTFSNGNTSPNVDLDSVSWHSPTRTATGITTSWGSYYFSNIYDIVITSNNGVYSCIYNPDFLQCFLTAGGQYNTYANYGQLFQSKYLYNQYGNQSVNSQTFSGTLTQVLSALSARCRHCNIYVDGIAWSLVGTPTYPIVIPDVLTVLNDQPAQYTFSEPTYIDLSGLTTLITNAINSSDIVTWQDIDDYFVDVNGVQALPTIQIIRNDYDNMYIDQYPYPATLIGMQDPLKFNEHMLDNVSGQYLNPMVNVADLTVDVLPTELKWVLGIGAILSIFALIINRLLE